ncbi:MAG: EF-Tu/IF-2/RF-3 family GTPase [Candidatus Aenigmatarchaeota archaeon]
MKNLNVGIFHADGLGSELGKKGTESDIALYNRKTDDCVYTFMESVGGKLLAEAQILSAIDAAMVSFEKITPEVGETVIMLDYFNISKGIVLVPEYVDLRQVAALTKGTTLESFVVKQKDPQKIMEYLEKLDIARTDGKKLVSIDHSFSVRGVGEVMLGFVKRGTIKKHDKLMLVPGNKEAVVRSIQMQDKDFDEAEPGSRVGLAIKGPTSEEMKRGHVLCEPETVKCQSEVTLKFEKNPFYKDAGSGKCHVIVGMQSVPATLVVGETAKIMLDRPVVYSEGETFLVVDLNAEKTHIIGKGTA